MAQPLPDPYPEGSTVETIWLDHAGQPTDQAHAYRGETTITTPDGDVQWLSFDTHPVSTS